MSKTITIDVFDLSSIDAAVREIREYSKWVQRKTDELRERIAYFIAKDASAVFNTAVVDDLIGEGAVTGSVNVVVENQGDNMTVVIANGEDAVFMEFGAGVYYNGAAGSSPHPYGVELGYTIGDYGWGFGQFDEWGYTNANGKYRLTHGTPAAMPLYNAGVAIRQNARILALAHFRSY